MKGVVSKTGAYRLAPYEDMNQTKFDFLHLSSTGVLARLGVYFYPSQLLSGSFAAIAISISITGVMKWNQDQEMWCRLTTEAI